MENFHKSKIGKFCDEYESWRTDGIHELRIDKTSGKKKQKRKTKEQGLPWWSNDVDSASIEGVQAHRLVGELRFCLSHSVVKKKVVYKIKE